ncbi:MAG TPA: hypothetical protein VGR04_09950 [Acidimicrobiia bacterium]|nr:hypothetical protein [Acidimicrobiia bacterium]
MAEAFHTQVRPRVEQLLAPGENLEGVCAATQQSTFRGGMFALVVTDRRLLVQPLDRHAQPKGDAVSIPPEELATFDAVGLGGEWYNAEPSMLENTALTVRVKAAHGQKLKLHMMRGGDGLFGRLGGGDGQQAGIAALATWVRHHREG